MLRRFVFTLPKLAKILLCVYSLTLVISNPLFAEEETEEIVTFTANPLYAFADHLEEAKAQVDVEDEVSVGVWKENRIEFPKLAERHHVKVAEGTFEGKKRSGIYFHPVKKGFKKIQFSNVPLGSQIQILYGLDDAAVEAHEEAAYVYLRIWIGNHMLKRILIPNQKGWFFETVSFGPAAFLNEKVVVAFDVFTDFPQDRHLYFQAAVVP